MADITVTPLDDIPVEVASLNPGDTIIFTAGEYNLTSNIIKGDVTFYLEEGAILKSAADLFVGVVLGSFTLLGEGQILSGNISIAAASIKMQLNKLVSPGVVQFTTDTLGFTASEVFADVDTSGQVSYDVYLQSGRVTHNPGAIALPASFTMTFVDTGGITFEGEQCFANVNIQGLIGSVTDGVILDRTVCNLRIDNAVAGSKVLFDSAASVVAEFYGVPPQLEFLDEESQLTVTGSMVDTLHSTQDQPFVLRNCTIVASGNCLTSDFPITVGIDETVTLNSGTDQIGPNITLVKASGILLQQMIWGGNWDPDRTEPYDIFTQVHDEGWLMVANKPTLERPAPQPSGDPTADLPETPAWTEQSNSSVIYSGHKYTFTKGGWWTILQAAVPELTVDTNYRVIVINATDPANPVVNIIPSPILAEDDWATIALAQVLVREGQVFYVVIDALNSGSDTVVTGGWTYDGTSNSANPGAQGWNRRNNNATVRIDKTDLDSVDRASELLGVTPGSTIQIVETAAPSNSFTYEVTAAPTDGGSSVNYQTSLIDSNGSIPTSAVCTITITIPVPSPTKYLELPNYWPTGQPNWATVEGYLEYDGVSQPGVTDNAYGIRVTFQEAYVSPDWDFAAYSGIGSSGGSGGGGGDTSTGLERIDEGNGPGWRLKGKDPANYGNIGDQATDLSESGLASSVNGATGAHSVAGGETVIASGTHSVTFGLDNNNAGPYGFIAGTGNSSSGSGIGAAVFGVGSQANALASFAAGNSVQAVGSNSSAFGQGTYTYTIGGMAVGLFNTGSINDIMFQVGIGADASNRADAFTVKNNGRVIADALTPALIETTKQSVVTQEWAQKKTHRSFKTETGTVTLTSMQGTDLDFLGSSNTQTIRATGTVRFASAPTVDVRLEFRIFYGSNQYQSVWVLPANAFINSSTTYVAKAEFNNFATGWNITIIEVAVKELNSPSGVNASYLRLDIEATDIGNDVAP